MMTRLTVIVGIDYLILETKKTNKTGFFVVDKTMRTREKKDAPKFDWLIALRVASLPLSLFHTPFHRFSAKHALHQPLRPSVVNQGSCGFEFRVA